MDVVSYAAVDGEASQDALVDVDSLVKQCEVRGSGDAVVVEGRSRSD